MRWHLSERFFSARELAAFRRLPLAERSEAANAGAPGEADESRWRCAAGRRRFLEVRSFKPADRHVSAVAAEGTDLRLHFWNWGRDRLVHNAA
jgi:hypothetical protein